MSTTKTVRISTAKVGTNMGHCGVVKALNGRIIAEGEVRPTIRAAREDALAIANKNGWRVELPTTKGLKAIECNDEYGLEDPNGGIFWPRPPALSERAARQAEARGDGAWHN